MRTTTRRDLSHVWTRTLCGYQDIRWEGHPVLNSSTDYYLVNAQSVTAGAPRCMEVDPGSMNMLMAPCNPRNHLQRFRWDHAANPTRFISLYNDLGSTMCIYDNGAYVERGDCLVDETEVWYWNG